MEHLSQFIINHWMLCSLLIIILALIFFYERQEQKKHGKELSPHEAVSLINHDNAIVIDLRDAESYRKGHIIDSIRASSEDFEQNRMNKYKNKPVILVCARGLQSAPLAGKLRAMGFTRPMALSGGIQAWQTADLPIIKGK
ncbi:rhodanese-like domain-containing protein [Legionella spiritensis]|uniref:rhodanese-like domain-containing protein n=1 Tax=Legionella spiritensis TaxID=452 RepID=UPI000F70956B|nr:rhodanese-like domain-containing protein [Legionella spiritensis]VEG92352.1 rhodanese-related sulfurtransferase [Legionella spiritensis]